MSRIVANEGSGNQLKEWEIRPARLLWTWYTSNPSDADIQAGYPGVKWNLNRQGLSGVATKVEGSANVLESR